MRHEVPVCSKLLWAALFMLALLLAGCAGFPARQKDDSRLEHVSTSSFDERVLKCDKPVLVDFYADWCGPCKRLSPILEEFALDHPEIRVVKVNVDDNSELVARYGVKGMPTLILIRSGQVTSQSTGFVPKEKLKEMLSL